MAKKIKVIIEKKEKLIEKMFASANGYGLADKGIGDGKKIFEECLQAIPDKHFEDFIYTLYRIADKSGKEGFILE